MPNLFTEEAAHALGLLIGLPFSSGPHLTGRRQDPVQVKGRAYVVSRTILDALRTVHPVVILLEDLHWCDAASWDYLIDVLLEGIGPVNPSEQLAIPRFGIFILATTRPEWSPPAKLTTHPAYTPLEIQRLSLQACQDLVENLMKRVDGVPEYVSQLLIERSEGVPYFIEELFNWLLDRGVIDQQGQPWLFLPERWQETPLPQTLQHLLLARLGAIPQSEQAALMCGAVFGRNFWESGIEAMDVANSHTLLSQTQTHGFVVLRTDSTFAGEREWSFYHNLLREATYESVLKHERRKLHNLAAQWLEEQARQAGRLDEFAGLLAEHYDLAGEGEKAADYYLHAGQHAKERFTLGEVRRFADRALALLPDNKTEQQWQAFLLRTSVLGMLSENRNLQADLERMLAIAISSGNEQWLAETYHRKGYYLTQIGDSRSGIQAYEKAISAARRAGDRAIEGLSLSLLAINLTRMGK